MRIATPFGFGALLIASTGLLYCGSDDTNSIPGNGTSTTVAGAGGGRPGTTSGGTTTGGTTTGNPATTTGNPATTTGGPATTTGGGVGGAGGAAGAGGGGFGGRPARDAGGMGGATTDAAAGCPTNPPANGSACTNVNMLCTYPGLTCFCVAARGGGTGTFACNDGGRGGG